MNYFEETSNYFNILSNDEKQLNHIELALNLLINKINKVEKMFYTGDKSGFADIQHLETEFIGKFN